jgi:aspartyl-tRNA(Asn)/glutamyl-tRNA(Gln) amidotransferase subunit A
MTYLSRNGLLARYRSLPFPSTALSRPWTVQHQERRHSCTQPLPPRMTIARAARLFRSSKLTSGQLCQHSYNLAFFGENSLHLNSYAKLLPLDQILQQACQSDERIRNGNSKGLLDGIPVTIKANIAVGKYWEMPNSCSAILSLNDEEVDDECTNTSDEDECSSHNHVYESDIARRLLKDCGAVLIGITNMDEFGMGSLGINNGLHRGVQHKRFSPTYNPLPWMQRLASLLDSSRLNSDCDDDYWLKMIRNSTPRNPHGIGDENGLANILEEAQHWIRGVGIKDNNCHTDESPLFSPGGSSAGAAVTASHGSSLLSIGTDTGGSLRLPSAWTSTVGFKPSYGTFSRYGVVSYVSSLDTVGFITGTTECAELAWRCLGTKSKESYSSGCSSGWNSRISRDSTARVYHNESNLHELESHVPMSTVEKPLANIRVGIPSAFSLEEIPPSIATAWSESARSLQNVGGATLVTISESKLPPALIRLALASYYVLACAEASSNLSRYDGLRFGTNVNLDAVQSEHDAGFGPLCDMTALEQQISANRVLRFGGEIQRRVLAGASVLSSDRFHTHYEAAAVARANISRSIDSVFRSSVEHDSDDDRVDVIFVPTAVTFPPTLNGDEVQLKDPTAAFANDVMTIPISLGGFPSVSVPVNVERVSIEAGNPVNAMSKMIGMQLFASKGSDDLVLRVATALQRTVHYS